MRRWHVAGGLLLRSDSVLLVANRRRNGSVDWSPPGGVVDEGETPVEALTREVAEETGLAVVGWERRCWQVEVEFTDLEMHLLAEVHLASEFAGDLVFDDPDGIVHDGGFYGPDTIGERLVEAPPWIADPLLAWVVDPESDDGDYRYQARGRSAGDLRTTRLR